jgi:hypothetical protein
MASKLFLVDLDLNLNKAKNFRLEDFSTDPSTSLESGRLVYFTGIGVNQNHFKAYNGTAWKTLAYTDDVPDIEISLEAATGFTVSGSPADASGTLTFEWDEVAPGYVLAGALDANTSPAPGNSIPTFRALGEQDIPVEIARVEDVNTSLDEYILLTEKGEPLGVAELNASGTVPAEQLDLGNYVTLDGSQTISGQKTFNNSLNFEYHNTDPSYDFLVGTLNFYESGSNGTGIGGFGQISINTAMENASIALNAYTTGSSISLSSNTDITLTAYDGDVIIGSNSGGEYLGSVDPDNQIAVIGDLFEISATVTGTTGQISVEDTGTNDYVVSLPDTVTLGTDGNKGRLLLGNANYAAAGSFEIDNSDQLTISSDYGDIFLATASGSTAYLGSITSGSQIATIGDIQALDAYDITATQISNWDTAYGWGDHSVEGYLTTAVQAISNTDGNITFSASTGSVTADLATDVEIAGDLIVQGDLTVNGDVTTLNTATMNVEDNIFVLNSNVTGTPSVDAGIEVERGTYDNASIYWNETLNKWWVSTPADAATSGTPAQQIARKVVRTTTGTTHSINHGLVTEDVTVNCWLDGEQVEVSVVITDENTVTVTTNSSITNLKTVVVG